MILTLTYHCVNDSDYAVAVSPRNFSAQLSYLKRKGFQFIFAADMPRYASAAAHEGKKIACITFDDGTRDIYTEALPILKELSIPATVFLATDFVGTVHENAEGVRSQFLYWDDMREMVQSGLISIQNHTHHHKFLTELPDADIDAEIRTANGEIQRELGTTVTAIAYPKGRSDARVQKIAARSCRVGFATVGVIQSGDIPEIMAVPRVPVHRRVALWKFIMRTKPLFWRLDRIRRRPSR
jgi:peptidoglycan/xylan/chitin deacetylase (PgdA/CDA1 family)